MRSRRLLWQLFPSFLFLTAASLLAVTAYTSLEVKSFYLDQVEEDLASRARLLEDRCASDLAAGREGGLDAACKDLAARSGTRITVIRPDGEVIADSAEDPRSMDNHADRPEIREARAGGEGTSMRYSHTLGKRMMYFALPLEEGGRTVGFLRTAIPVTRAGKVLADIYRDVAAGGVVIALAAALASFLLARRLSRPLERMREGAERFARGELGHKLRVHETREMSVLADTMNEMAAQLDGRIRTVVRQRNEQEAVLSSMVEGVLAVDREEKLISMNRAAGRLLGTDPSGVAGRSLPETVRNISLQRFAALALERPAPVEEEIVLLGEKERYLQAHGSALEDERGERIGAVVVLNDVTRLRRLERVRRDFVANVSHELKTPITAIKGYVETLRDGALEDREDALRFLDVLARQTDRLGAIIEDLLLLARIEQEEEREAIRLEPGPVAKMLGAAVQACVRRADERGVSISLDAGDELEAPMNETLLEQAVSNLIDNAVKYSPEGSRVEVEARKEDGEISIRVADHGAGIEKKHLDRIFERFYRVDEARSRKAGGTGLGLSIVKHIAQVHGGSVRAESVPGEGSTFVITIPLQPAEREPIARDSSPGSHGAAG